MNKIFIIDDKLIIKHKINNYNNRRQCLRAAIKNDVQKIKFYP